MAARTGIIAVMTLALISVLSTYALGGQNPNGRAAIHVKAHPTSCTQGYPSFTKCQQIVSTYWDLGDVDVIPVVFDLSGYTQIGLRVTWPSEWGSMSWVRCKGDAATGQLVHPSDYTCIYWQTCQHAWSAAPGYGWLYAPSRGNVCTVSGCVAVDCSPAPGPYIDRLCRGCSGIGGWIGDDPCSAFSVTEPTTWGAIKSVFGE